MSLGRPFVSICWGLFMALDYHRPLRQIPSVSRNALVPNSCMLLPDNATTSYYTYQLRVIVTLWDEFMECLSSPVAGAVRGVTPRSSNI